MLKNHRLQMIAIAAISSLLGYGAASGKLDLSRKANAESATECCGRQRKQLYRACRRQLLREGSTKSRLVAVADPRVNVANSKVDALRVLIACINDHFSFYSSQGTEVME